MNYKGNWSNVKLEELIEEPIPVILEEEIPGTEYCDYCGDEGPLEQVLNFLGTVVEICKQCKERM